jgi:hypothetical protein
MSGKEGGSIFGPSSLSRPIRGMNNVKVMERESELLDEFK